MENLEKSVSKEVLKFLDSAQIQSGASNNPTCDISEDCYSLNTGINAGCDCYCNQPCDSTTPDCYGYNKINLD